MRNSTRYALASPTRKGWAGGWQIIVMLILGLAAIGFIIYLAIEVRSGGLDILETIKNFL